MDPNEVGPKLRELGVYLRDAGLPYEQSILEAAAAILDGWDLEWKDLTGV